MLPLIYFGRRRTKDLGETSPGYCDYCGNQVWWTLVRGRKWITFFFIPLLPLGRTSHYLSCSMCGASRKIDGDLAARSREMLETTEKLQRGEIGEEAYFERVDSFASELHDSLGLETKSEEELPGGPPTETRYIQ